MVCSVVFVCVSFWNYVGFLYWVLKMMGYFFSPLLTDFTFSCLVLQSVLILLKKGERLRSFCLAGENAFFR